MDLSVLVMVSCVLTTISMLFIIGFLVYLIRFGGQGVKGIVDRIMGGDDNQQQVTPKRPRRRANAVASSQSLRQRARNLDFPAPSNRNLQSAGQFGAQVAGAQAISNTFSNASPQNNQVQSGQRASLRPRGGGQQSQYPEFNPQSAGGNQGFQMSTPSLSPSRPFQGGSEIPRPQQGQSFNQPNQYGQGQRPQQGQSFNQPNQYGQGQRPQQGQSFNQPNQYGQGQQFNAQSAPPPPLNSLGQQNRPPLRSRPNFDAGSDNRGLGGRDRRQGDDYDRIYDDGGGRGGNFIEQAGDFIDNF